MVSHWCRRLKKILSKKWSNYQAQRRANKQHKLTTDTQAELLGNSTEMKIQNAHENDSPMSRRQSVGFKSNGSTKRESLRLNLITI